MSHHNDSVLLLTRGFNALVISFPWNKGFGVLTGFWTILRKALWFSVHNRAKCRHYTSTLKPFDCIQSQTELTNHKRLETSWTCFQTSETWLIGFELEIYIIYLSEMPCFGYIKVSFSHPNPQYSHRYLPDTKLKQCLLIAPIPIKRSTRLNDRWIQLPAWLMLQITWKHHRICFNEFSLDELNLR